MSIEVQMCDDIRKYEVKTMGPLTTRQAICVVIGVILAIPMWFFLPFSWDNKLLCMMAVIVPIGLCGFMKMDGSYLEVFFLRFLYLRVLTPAKRKCKRTISYKSQYIRLNEKIRAKQGKTNTKQKVSYNKVKVYK